MASTENDSPPLYAGSKPSSITTYTPGYPPGGYSTWSLSGIRVSEKDGILNFLKTGTASRRSWRQWAGAGWAFPSMSTSQGLVIVYRIRWNNVIGAGELRMSIPSLATISNDESLVLLFRNGEISWEIYNFKTKLFVHQDSSKISADRGWHDILIHIAPGSLRVYEDGRNILAKTRSGTVSGSFDIICELDELEIFDADLMGFKTLRIDAYKDKPAVGLQNSTSTELVFNLQSKEFNTQYLTFKSSGNITSTYTENSLRFFGEHEAPYMGYRAGSIKYISAISPYNVIEYCFKVNKFWDDEAKIVMAGGLILSNEYNTFGWQYFDQYGKYNNVLSHSANFCEGSPYVSVLVITSPGGWTVFENGGFELQLAASRAADSDILFEVGDFRTPVDVELSYIRIISGI